MSEEQADKTWQTQINDEGEFVRRPTAFHEWVTADGSSGFQSEPNRYHLYVCYACPWAHRTLITRQLKGLEHVISVDVTHSFLGNKGWSFRDDEAGATGDTVNGFAHLREAYTRTASDYEGSITVPVLWDKQKRRIVNNESAEIIRMLNHEFQEFAEHPEVDLYPEALRDNIDSVNAWVYDNINNGVYRCGFARSQRAYDRAAKGLFDSLDRIEAILNESRYLCGHELTEADVRLVTTLLRFDLVYNTHFKCNLRRIVDYPNIWGFTRDMYSLPAVSNTTNTAHIRDHYYRSHESINPYRIVPIGPEVDFSAPHDRASRFG